MSDSEELESDQELAAAQPVDSESLNSEDSYDETSFAQLHGSSQLRKGKARATQEDETDSEPEQEELLSSPPAKRKRTEASSESLGSDEDDALEEENSSRRVSKRRKDEHDDSASEDIGSEESDASDEDEDMPSSRANGVRFAEPVSDNDPPDDDSSVDSLGFGSDDGAPTSQSGAVQSRGPAMLGPAVAKPLMGTSSLTNNDDELASGSEDE